MFIVLAIIIGLIIGLIRKGSISKLFSSRPKLWYLGLIGVLIQIFLHISYNFPTLQLGMIGTVLQFLSYILILVMLIFNFNNMWAVIFAVGVTICFIVTFLNGGLMPVSDAVYNTLNNNTLAQSLTKEVNNVYTLMSGGAMTLWFLGIYLPVPFLAQITSLYGAVPGIAIGEILIWIGLIGWVQYAMCKAKVKKQPAAERLEFDPNSDEEPVARKHRKNTLFEDDDDEDGIFGDKEFTGSFLSNKGDRDLLEEALREEEEREKAERQKMMEKDAEDPNAITRVIPELSVSDGFDDAYTIKKPLTADEDHLDDTKVFTGFKELVFDDEPEDATPEVSDEPQETKQQDEGYFTQLFYAEKQAEEEARKACENPVWDPTSAFFVKSDVGEPVSFDESIDEPDTEPEEKSSAKTYNWITTPKYKQTSNFDRSNSQTSVDNEAPVKEKSKVTEEEMLNVWKQVSVDMQNNKHQRSKTYADDANPFRAANEERQRELEELRQREAARKIEDRKKAILEEKWDAYKQNFFKDEGVMIHDDRPADSTKPVTSLQEVMPTAPAPTQAVEKTPEDLKKESMGFEKVTIEVEGRQVSFWQRKK